LLLVALASLLVISEEVGEQEWGSSEPASGSQESEETVIQKLLVPVIWKGVKANCCSQRYAEAS